MCAGREFRFIGMAAVVGAGFLKQPSQHLEFMVRAGSRHAEAQGLVEPGPVISGLRSDHAPGQCLGGFGIGLGVQGGERLQWRVGDAAFHVGGVGIRTIKGG